MSTRAAVLMAVATVLGACGGAAHPLERAATEPTLDDEVAIATGERFLEDFVDGDGRVVRHDQGDDTVSEGQAYAMLVAVAVDDEVTFREVWRWTREHLLRGDGLLAWRWADGRVADPMPATDADVDAAHALSRAAERFGDEGFADDARLLADAVLDHSTIEGRLGPVAVAGPWATGDPAWVNPGYGDPAGYEALGRLTGDERWRALDDAARRVVAGATSGTDLPADWAVLTPTGIEPRAEPSGDGSIAHGYDAVRASIRLAADCEPEGRALAAAMDDEYDAAALADGGPAAVLDLHGRPLVDHGHPVATVAAAAAALAGGDHEDAGRLLGVAERQLADDPSYYGSAWVALGRLWLTTERLGGCAA